MSEQTGGHVGGKPKNRDEMLKVLADAVTQVFTPEDVWAAYAAEVKDLKGRLKVATDAAQILDEQYKAKKAEVEKLNEALRQRDVGIENLRRQSNERGEEIERLIREVSTQKQDNCNIREKLRVEHDTSDARQVTINCLRQCLDDLKQFMEKMPGVESVRVSDTGVSVHLKEYVDSSAKQAAELQGRLAAAGAIVQSNVGMRAEIARELEQAKKTIETERLMRNAVTLGKFSDKDIVDECWRRHISTHIQTEFETPETRGKFLKECITQLVMAYTKHGRRAWTRHEFMGVLREEFEEAWDAVKQDLPDGELQKEIAQIVCVCMRFMETGAGKV